MIKISENDLELVGKIKLGDEKSFAELFQKYYEPMYNFGLCFLHDREESENIVQDIFVKLWLDKEKINIQSNVKSYLYSAVKNHSLNFLNRQKRLQSIESNEISIGEKQTRPDDELICKDNKCAVQNAIDQLPEKCRQIYMMKKYEDLSYKEISAMLGISINTVKTQMKRALKSLFEKLQYLKILIIALIAG